MQYTMTLARRNGKYWINISRGQGEQYEEIHLNGSAEIMDIAWEDGISRQEAINIFRESIRVLSE